MPVRQKEGRIQHREVDSSLPARLAETAGRKEKPRPLTGDRVFRCADPEKRPNVICKWDRDCHDEPRWSPPVDRAGMGTREELLRWRVCRGIGCGEVFWICCHCDRGHRYCSERCREKKRQQRTRAANKKHQKSEEGAARSPRPPAEPTGRSCRRRVTDQPSAPTGPGSIVETEPSPAKDGPGSGSVEARYAEIAKSEPACIICGRTLGPAPSKRPSFPDGG